MLCIHVLIIFYQGKVNGQAYKDTPHRCGHSCQEHEFYDQRWNQSLAPLVSKLRNTLVTATSQLGLQLDPLQKRLLDIGSGAWDYCTINRSYRGYATMSLMTAGNEDIPGFCNMNHKDLRDKYEDIGCACKARILHNKVIPRNMYEESRKRYSLHVLSHIGLGMPTICGYYLHSERKSFKQDMFHGYFMMPGLGCAVKLCSFYYNYFHGYAFDHFTSVPYVLIDGDVHFKQTDVNMIAWGPSNIIKRRRRKRIRAIELNIINESQRLTKRQIDEYFKPHPNHPERFLFGIDNVQVDMAKTTTTKLSV